MHLWRLQDVKNFYIGGVCVKVRRYNLNCGFLGNQLARIEWKNRVKSISVSYFKIVSFQLFIILETHDGLCRAIKSWKLTFLKFEIVKYNLYLYYIKKKLWESSESL